MRIKQTLLAAAITLALLLGCDGSVGGSGAQQQGVVSVTEEGYTNVNGDSLQDALGEIPAGQLSPAELNGLLFMREEEKLAHDVYVFLYSVWDLNVFNNIAKSEQSHTDAVQALLDRYAVADPTLGKAEGEFANPDLQALYDTLVVDGSASLINALMVGAAIEEIDILDIELRKNDVVANDDILLVYDNLLKGSRNHLRSFVSNLARQGVNYTPQYLAEDAFAAIVGSEIESGSSR